MALQLTTTLLKNEKGEVLLIRRANEPFHDQWSLPGGKVEKDEAIDESAKREIHEELGIVDVDFKKLGQEELTDPGVATVYIFEASIAFETQIQPSEKEVSDVVWVNLENLDHYEPFPPNHRMVLDSYGEKETTS